MKKLMDRTEVERALDRMACEILEQCQPGDKIALLGIRTRGVHLADRLKSRLEKALGHPIPQGTLDITLYRDDLSVLASAPVVRESIIPFDTTGRILVLVDDVIYTGRTVRAALDQIIDYGRPLAVRLAVLVDRGGREMPIQPDFTGREIPLRGPHERIEVKFDESDSDEGVYQG